MEAGSTTSENAMKGYRTKKIALPGGRQIEIVYFYDDEVEATVGTKDPETSDEGYGLHICPECDSDLVYPVAWEERGDNGWLIERRCPNCEWRHKGDFEQADVEEFDDVLNDGTESLLTGLRNFSRANMAADVERLIEAIEQDLIIPMDF